MKNDILIHKNSSANASLKKLFIALLPLILYGFYKNGILLYLDGSINSLSIFKPVLFPLIGIFSGLLINYIIKNNVYFNELVLYGLLIGMIVPLSTNILLFFIALPIFMYACTILEKKNKINIVCLIKIAIILLTLIFRCYEYGNINELNIVYNVSFLDMLFGRGIGGVCSTSIILIFIGFVYLLTDYYYKKEIPIFAMLSYSIICLIIFFITKDSYMLINNLINSTPIFAFVFVAPISVYSSYTPKGKVVFGILIGVLSGILLFLFGINEAVIVAIILVSLLKNIIDDLATKIAKNR